MSIFTIRRWVQPSKTGRGFGLIELIVSIGIMTLVATTVLFRQTSFNNAVVLENQAYEVAFDIRQTQLQAVSAQGGVDGDFRARFGIQFTIGQQLYQVYRSSGTNYTLVNGTPLGAPFRVDNRFVIDRFEIIGDSDITSGSLSILFQRPNFDSIFYAEGSLQSYDEIAIVIRGVNDPSRERRVLVTSSGQVTVE